MLLRSYLMAYIIIMIYLGDNFRYEKMCFMFRVFIDKIQNTTIKRVIYDKDATS